MEHYNIIDGPSKWDLILALFDAATSHDRKIYFNRDRGDDLSGNYSTSVSVLITAIGRKDISGENWNFNGIVSMVENTAVRGCFSTKTRAGWIEIGTPEELFEGFTEARDALRVELYDERKFEGREAEVRVYLGTTLIASVTMAVGFGPGADGNMYATLEITKTGDVKRPR